MPKTKSIEKILRKPENMAKYVEQIKINEMQSLSVNQRAEIMGKLVTWMRDNDRDD